MQIIYLSFLLLEQYPGQSSESTESGLSSLQSLHRYLVVDQGDTHYPLLKCQG